MFFKFEGRRACGSGFYLVLNPQPYLTQSEECHVIFILIFYNAGIFIVAAKRTPFGSFGGKLVQYSATDLCEIAGKAALAAGNINPEIIDSTVVAHVAPVGLQINQNYQHILFVHYHGFLQQPT